MTKVHYFILVVFVAGKPLYKIKETEGNIMVDVVKCMSVRELTNVNRHSRFY